MLQEYPQAVVEITHKGQLFLVEQVSPYHYHIKVNNKIKHLKLSANEAMKIVAEQINNGQTKTVSLKNSRNKEMTVGAHRVQINDLDDGIISVEITSYPCLELAPLEKWKKDKTYNQKAKAFKELVTKHDNTEEKLEFSNFSVTISPITCVFNQGIPQKREDYKEERAILDNWYYALKVDDDFPLNFEANFEFKDSACKLSMKDFETVVNKLNQMQSEIEKILEHFLNS